MRPFIISLIAGIVLAAAPAAAAPKRIARHTAAKPIAPVLLPDGTKVIEVRIGRGVPAAPGQSVTVNYTGWLYVNGKRGTQFDSSIGREPFTFPLGLGQVIGGWDSGVEGMKAGGKRTLIIPPAAGYGDRGAGADIPPGATLIFDVELLQVE